MNKMKINFKLPVLIMKEGEKYIAFTPALDLSTSGRTKLEVKKHFHEMVNMFFEELIENDTLDEVLKNQGWSKGKKKWIPPMIVSSELESISVCS